MWSRFGTSSPRKCWTCRLGRRQCLQCLRPEYNAYLDIQQEERIIELVQRLFNVWTSDKLSLDERHNTQLYARFLKQLMEPHLARLAEKKRAATEGPASGSSAPAHVNGNGHAAPHQQSQPQTAASARVLWPLSSSCAGESASRHPESPPSRHGRGGLGVRGAIK